jgi:hypothetical protein
MSKLRALNFIKIEVLAYLFLLILFTNKDELFEQIRKTYVVCRCLKHLLKFRELAARRLCSLIRLYFQAIFAWLGSLSISFVLE